MTDRQALQVSSLEQPPWPHRRSGLLEQLCLPTATMTANAVTTRVATPPATRLLLCASEVPTTAAPAPTPSAAFSSTGTGQAPVSSRIIRPDNADELRLLAKRSRGLGGVSALVFSPDGTRLASTGFGGPALWALPDLTLLSRDMVIDQSSGQGAIAFSPDGRILATGGESGRITLWDAEIGDGARPGCARQSSLESTA